MCHTSDTRRPRLLCHAAEFPHGVLEQVLNLIGAAPLERAEFAAWRAGLVKPDVFPGEHIDRVFGTDGALAFAELSEPEIGVGMVGRPVVKIEIDLERNMVRLKLSISQVDSGQENPADPFYAGLKGGYRLACSFKRRRSRTCPSFAFIKSITERWHPGSKLIRGEADDEIDLNGFTVQRTPAVFAVWKGNEQTIKGFQPRRLIAFPQANRRVRPSSIMRIPGRRVIAASGQRAQAER